MRLLNGLIALILLNFQYGANNQDASFSRFLRNIHLPLVSASSPPIYPGLRTQAPGKEGEDNRLEAKFSRFYIQTPEFEEKRIAIIFSSCGDSLAAFQNFFVKFNCANSHFFVYEKCSKTTPPSFIRDINNCLTWQHMNNSDGQVGRAHEVYLHHKKIGRVYTIPIYF